MNRGFTDRRDGGRALAERLTEHRWHRPLVLGIARGGVPVARAVADELGADLDVSVARKIGAPGRPEFGVGAVTASGPPTFDTRSLAALHLTEEDLTEICESERAEARRRVELYQDGRPAEPYQDRDVIVVDDGLATGVTATAALRAAGEHHPHSLVFATPVCAPDAATSLRGEADDVVCALSPPDFRAVGQWYRDFHQTTDAEVIDLLRGA